MIHLSDIIKAYQKKGFDFYENDTKPFNLNYGGIRKPGGEWNDKFFLIWKYQGSWNLLQWRGTTDPSAYYLKNPLNILGTAVLPEGQHKGLFKLGLHKGKYEALVQARPVKVFRDNNRDELVDTDSITDEGWFGINSHRAYSGSEIKTIGKYSAGCQVTVNPDEYIVFIEICKKAFENWGSALTYTLFNIDDF